MANDSLVVEGSRMAQRVGVRAIKPSWNSQGRSRKLAPQSCPVTSTCIPLQAQAHTHVLSKFQFFFETIEMNKQFIKQDSRSQLIAQKDGQPH